MAKKSFASLLHKPVNPFLVGAALLVIALLFIALITHNSSPTKQPKTAYSTPSRTLVISEMPDELKASRAISQNPFQEHNYSLSPFKTINDSAVVEKLYRAILALPPIPTEVTGEGHCVAHPFLMRYDLTFFKNSKLVQHGTINLLVGCGEGETVSLDGTYRREFYDRDTYRPFVLLLENTFGVAGSQLYNVTDPNWLRMRQTP